jgi:periplasmic protein TonB
VTDVPSPLQETLVVSPEDRLLALADPFWRNARRRFPQILIACLLVHLTILLMLFLMDQSDKNAAPAEKEIPVQVIIQPPPPPAPKPAPKKPEPKPKPKPKQEQPKPKYEREEKPAFDAPRAANQETIKREALDDKTRAPVQAKPAPANETKPTPEAPKPAQNAAPAPAEQTTSPEQPKDDKDAEALDKAAPIKARKSAQRIRQTKHRATLPDDERGAVARELASLEPSPNFTFAAKTEVSPVSGGTEDMRYLSVLFGLIMRQRHMPARILHNDVEVVVAFWVDDSGALVQTALYRTSGYPEFDREAVAAVRRAAPFPHPPYGEPHGFIAKMDFPAR